MTFLISACQSVRQKILPKGIWISADLANEPSPILSRGKSYYPLISKRRINQTTAPLIRQISTYISLCRTTLQVFATSTVGLFAEKSEARPGKLSPIPGCAFLPLPESTTCARAASRPRSNRQCGGPPSFVRAALRGVDHLRPDSARLDGLQRPISLRAEAPRGRDTNRSRVGSRKPHTRRLFRAARASCGERAARCRTRSSGAIRTGSARDRQGSCSWKSVFRHWVANAHNEN